MSSDHERIFTDVYASGNWGTNNDPLYKGSSGAGSSVEFNTRYIEFLRGFLLKNNIKTVLDLGCGDFRCGPSIYDDIDLTYYGYDTYKDLIERHKTVFASQSKYTFCHSNILDEKESLPQADVVILKDVLQHWNNSEVITLLDYLTTCKKFKYIIITNCSDASYDNYDTKTGKHRPLSARYMPLRKYMPMICLTYNRKEMSIIYC